MAHPNVPKFGNWESEENVPYTVYFDKARKNKGGKMINPNDPAENPDLVPSSDSSPPPPKPQTRRQEPSREEGDFRQFKKSPARGENMGHKSPARGENMGRGVLRSGGHGPNAGSEHSTDRSPLHPHHQTKFSTRGSPSPAWEGKDSYDNSHSQSHGTPGRSRLKPAQGNESPDRGAAVPVFGEWDENDPQSAENFTHIFNKVREERNNDIAGTPKHPSYGNQNQHSNKNNKTCCFPWC